MAFQVQPRETVTVRDARLIFKNFAGAAQKYNKEGDRNFSILLDEELAFELKGNRWNVKELNKRDPDDDQLYHLKVSVDPRARKSLKIWLITGQGTKRTLLSDDIWGALDFLESAKVDLEISPYDWTLDSGASGRKAYLQSLYFHLYESPLTLEYADVEEISAPPAADERPMQLEAGSRLPFDYEGTVVEDER